MLWNACRVGGALSLAVVLPAGTALAQGQMRRAPAAAPAAPAPPAAVVRVAPAPPVPPAPPPPSKAPAAIARVTSTAPPAPPLPRGGAPGRATLNNQPPTMNKGALAPNRTYVQFPQNLAHTVDPKVCTAHGGFAAGLGCTGGLPAGMLALVWDCPKCSADGYRLFRVDGGKHDPVAIPANGGAFMAALLDAPPGGFHDQCYAVEAYRGNYESAMSNSYCASGGSVLTTTTFLPDHVRTSTAYYWWGDPETVEYHSSGDLSVGGLHNSKKGTLYDEYANWIERGGLHFDLGALSQKHIFSARLHVTVDLTALDSGGVDHGTSCASLIGLGEDRWWTQTDWILVGGQQSQNGFETPARLDPGSMGGPDSTYDVTPIVADWARGAVPNFGLVLMTDDKVIKGFSNNGCLTNYTPDIKLEVQSY
jgi:hypothetical protein